MLSPSPWGVPPLGFNTSSLVGVASSPPRTPPSKGLTAVGWGTSGIVERSEKREVLDGRSRWAETFGKRNLTTGPNSSKSPAKGGKGKKKPTKAKKSPRAADTPSTGAKKRVIAMEPGWEFYARGAWKVRFLTISASLCCGLVAGFANFFWEHMIFMQEAERLAFIVCLGMLAGSLLTLAVKGQKRYVLRVSRDPLNPTKVKIACPYFFGSKSVSVFPKDIEPASITLSELLFNRVPKDATPVPDAASLIERQVFSIQVLGYKMIVDAEKLPRDERAKLLTLLGLR